MDLARLHAELAAADELPYGSQRTSRREELVAHAERDGDPAALASALLSLADDCWEDGDEQGMVLGFGRAWRIWQSAPQAFDAALRFRFREHFQHVVDALDVDERVPATEVDRLMDEMESFYLSGGYSLRAVHRSRYWIHRRRGEKELATLRIEALLAEDGDSGASCDACDLATAAYWYESQEDLPKAVDLWMAIIAGVRSCDQPHVGIAHGEVMIDLLNLDQYDKARQHHRLGYPAIRRRLDLPRQLELHALFVSRARDVLRGLELLHDHIDWLPAHRDEVGGHWWVHGRFLLLLKMLIDAGHGDLPITCAPRRIVTASALYGELDAVLADYAMHQDSAQGGTEYTETLEGWRAATFRHQEPPPHDEGPDAAWPRSSRPDSGLSQSGSSQPGLSQPASSQPSWLSLAMPPIPMPWNAFAPANDGVPHSLPRGFEPVDALAARARCLSFLRHPHACATWEQVASAASGLSDEVAAELSESRGTALAQRADHAAAHEQLAFAATLYTTLGRTADALRCRAMSAYELYLAGSEPSETAQGVQAEAWRAAQAEFEAGRITGTQLVTVRLYGLYRHLDRWRRVADAEPDVEDEVSRLVCEEASEEYRAFRQLAGTHGATAQHAAAARAWAEVTAAIARMFARHGEDGEAAGYIESLLDQLGELAELYAAVYQPWLAAEVQLRRGQVFLAARRPAEAEHCARQVSALADVPLAPHVPGSTALLLAEAINAQCALHDASAHDAQDGRDDEVVQAAARAARLLAGSDPVGAARARLLMGEVHHRSDRHEASLGFYDPALSQLAHRWEDEECRELIHRGALHYSISLCRLDRPRDAVRVLRDVLAAVPEQYPTARAWLLYRLAECAEQAGDLDAALAAYREAAHTARSDPSGSGYQPATAALESAARLSAPNDIRAALRHLGDAIEHLRACDPEDAQYSRDAEAVESAEFVESAEPLESADPADLVGRADTSGAAGERDRVNGGDEAEGGESARHRHFLIAEARTLGFKHVVKRIEMQTLPQEEATELLAATREAAETGVRELRALLDHPHDGDTPEQFVAALEAALKTLCLAVAVLEKDPGGAARRQSAFAADCERWGFAEYARTARENAEYFASRALFGDTDE